MNAQETNNVANTALEHSYPGQLATNIIILCFLYVIVLYTKEKSEYDNSGAGGTSF